MSNGVIDEIDVEPILRREEHHCINKDLLKRALCNNREHLSANNIVSGNRPGHLSEDDDGFETEFVALVTSATSLQLAFKNIKAIENLMGFKNLSKLSLANNRIERIQNLDELVRLEFLDLSFNKITRIEGLHMLGPLAELSLFNNEIEIIEGLESCKKLVFLSIGNNRIHSFAREGDVFGLRKCLGKLESLKAINLKGNPICDHVDYKMFCLAFLPKLTYLDYQKVHETDIARAHNYRQSILAADDIIAASSNRISATQIAPLSVDNSLRMWYQEIIDLIKSMSAKEYGYMQHHEVLPLVDSTVRPIRDHLTKLCGAVISEMEKADKCWREQVSKINECLTTSKLSSLSVAEDFSNRRHEINQAEGDLVQSKLMAVEVKRAELSRKYIDEAEVNLRNSNQTIVSLQQAFADFLTKSVCTFCDSVASVVTKEWTSSGCSASETLEESAAAQAKSDTSLDDAIREVIEMREKTLGKMSEANERLLSMTSDPIARKLHSVKQEERSRSRNRVSEILALVECSRQRTAPE